MLTYAVFRYVSREVWGDYASDCCGAWQRLSRAPYNTGTRLLALLVPKYLRYQVVEPGSCTRAPPLIQAPEYCFTSTNVLALLDGGGMQRLPRAPYDTGTSLLALLVPKYSLY